MADRFGTCGILLMGVFATARAETCQTLERSASKLMEAREYKAAVPTLEAALGACPNQNVILLDLAKAQLLSGQFEASLHTANTLLAREPANVSALVTKAQTLYFLARDAESERTLERAITLAPASSEAHYWLGREYYSHSRHEAALKEFQTVLKSEPKSYKAWENLGLCYEAMQDDGRAFRAYLKAIELVHDGDPKEEWPYVDMAELLLKQGEYKRAFDTAVEAAQRNPYSSSAAYFAGKALFKLDRLDLSARWLHRAASLDSTDPRPHYLLSLIDRKQGKTDDAQKEAKLVNQLQEFAPSRRR